MNEIYRAEVRARFPQASTATRDLTAILADLADFTVASTGTRAATLYHELEDVLRAELAPLPPEVEAELAAQAERDARTMAPPVPGVTRNAGYTVRAVIHAHDAESGLLSAWWVACESDDGNGLWVTWNAYALDGTRAGQLAYNAGHYFNSPTRACRDRLNRQRALADLAIRAGTMAGVALRIADELTRSDTPLHPTPAEDRRMARRLRKWATG